MEENQEKAIVLFQKHYFIATGETATEEVIKQNEPLINAIIEALGGKVEVKEETQEETQPEQPEQPEQQENTEPTPEETQPEETEEAQVIETFNKIQAINLMQGGKKVHHPLITNGKWVTIKNSDLYFENRVQCSAKEYFKYRSGPEWDKDWTEYKE